MLKRDVSLLLVEFVLSLCTENLSWGTLLCCVWEKFQQPISFWIRRVEVSKLSVESFLSDFVENFCRGTFSMSII